MFTKPIACLLICLTLGGMFMPMLPAQEIDPQMQAVLDEWAALKPKPLDTLTPEQARQQPSAADAVRALLKNQGKEVTPEEVGGVKDLTIPGHAKIPARVYTPQGEGPFPVLVFWHGGGWVIADLDTYDASARALCNAAECVVVSCHYRQAPEHPFPAAVEDAFAAYQWVLKHAEEIGGDAKRIAVAGESAGGNLAAATTLWARDKKMQMPVHQLLIYPVMNYAFDSDSYREHANAKPLNAVGMKWFWGHYLAKPTDGKSPYASPLTVADLSKLPPATVITAAIDPLRSEGLAYYRKLEEAGVSAEAVNFEGVTHEFFGMGAVVEKSKEAVDLAGVRLKQAFKK